MTDKHTDGRPGDELERRTTGGHDELQRLEGDPVSDPGLPPHELRPTDVDAALDKRAERQVAAMFGLATLLTIGSCVAYLAIDIHATFLGFNASNFAIGLCLGLALLLIGVGAIQWAKKLMGDHEIIEMRHPAYSSPEKQAETLEAVRLGTEESGIGRRSLIRNSLIGALGALGLPAVIFLGDLGPLPLGLPSRTVWKRGMRIVNDVTGEPLRPADLSIGQLVNAQPDILVENEADDHGGEHNLEGTALLNAKGKAAVVVVRMQPEEIRPYPGRTNWSIDGILCYSKICTHVGCPISLYEQTTHHLLCPCHQSTFDLANNGVVVFGPAARSLPQLPLGLDSEGFMIA
ncbi:MAG: cytochrome bc1 complex Rieske iron-sulfur subunit, partial [Nocardioidaceae bacterium]